MKYSSASRPDKIKLIWCSLPEFNQVLRGQNFSILGAGRATDLILEFISPLRPQYILDNELAKQGIILRGYTVSSLKALEVNRYAVIVPSTLNYFIAARDLQEASDASFVFVMPPPELVYGYN
jgi:hypothetical protein